MNNTEIISTQYDTVEGKLIVRKGSSDYLLVDEIWRQKQYFQHGCHINVEDIILDIGGHIGIFAVLASKLGAKFIHTYEPTMYSFTLLEKNIALNECKNINAHQYAVYDSEGTFNMDVPNAPYRIDTAHPGSFWNKIINFGAAHLTEVEAESSEQKCVTEMVKTVKITDLFDTIPGINLLKMDCEGSEYKILNSLSDDRLVTLNTILCEYHLGYSRGLVIVDRFKRLGFTAACTGNSATKHGMIYAHK